MPEFLGIQSEVVLDSLHVMVLFFTDPELLFKLALHILTVWLLTMATNNDGRWATLSSGNSTTLSIRQMKKHATFLDRAVNTEGAGG